MWCAALVRTEWLASNLKAFPLKICIVWCINLPGDLGWAGEWGSYNGCETWHVMTVLFWNIIILLVIQGALRKKKIDSLKVADVKYWVWKMTLVSTVNSCGLPDKIDVLTICTWKNSVCIDLVTLVPWWLIMCLGNLCMLFKYHTVIILCNYSSYLSKIYQGLATLYRIISCHNKQLYFKMTLSFCFVCFLINIHVY